MLAKKSLSFNLKNPQFVELFPEMCEEIRERLSERKKSREKIRANVNNTISNDAASSENSLNTNLNNSMLDAQDPSEEVLQQRGIRSLTNCPLNWQSNLVTLVCFAIFTFIVNYVLQNITYE